MTVYCLPGNRICLADNKYISGPGTYERKGYIHASIAGVVNLNNKESSVLVEVLTNKGQNTVPTPGDVVTAEVTLITQRYIKCNILCIRDTPLEKRLRGIVKKEDIRATEKDKIEMYKCFRPGDIILARVLPIKELLSYQLTTAENELGVVIAYGESGAQLVPVSWTEMQCPVTYSKEYRKVAKVVPEDA